MGDWIKRFIELVFGRLGWSPMTAVVIATLVQALAFNLAYAYVWNVPAFPLYMTDKGWSSAVAVLVVLFCCNTVLALASRVLADKRANERVDKTTHEYVKNRLKAAQLALLDSPTPRLIVDNCGRIEVQTVEADRVAIARQNVESG